jgi:membrane-associated phospholipid phosphatase
VSTESSRAANRRLQDRPLLHDHPLALRISLGLWVFAGLVFVAIAVPWLADTVQLVDDAVFQAMVDAEWGPLIAIAHVLDFIGSTWITAPIIVVVAIHLAWRTRWEALITWVIAMAASQVLIGPVKAIYERMRPPQSLVETSSFSFPSGHAVAGAAVAVGLVIVLVRAGPRRRNLEMLAAAFAIAMAFSRVYLRAHWLTDVTAGVALGAAVAVATAAIVHRVDEAIHET